MATAVMQPLSSLSLGHEIMPPSPISQNSSRHGRGRQGSSTAKKGRGRGYSAVEDRETLVLKALSRALKRTVSENDEESEGETALFADAEGWVDFKELLARPNLAVLDVTLAELQDFISSPTPKVRFALKSRSESVSDSSNPADYLIRATSATKETANTTTTQEAVVSPLTLQSTDLPELVIYETSYANYPLILSSGGIKRAGGQSYLSFTPLKVSATAEAQTSSAEVSIYVFLRSVMEAHPEINWLQNENGTVITEGDSSGTIVKALWKKAVARRPDIGVLFEDGESKKEVPIGLRGKGAKPKKGGKGRSDKAVKELKARSEDEESMSD